MNRIKALRLEKNWTQDELGNMLNVKRAAVSKYEGCRIPLTDDTLLKLSKIFNVSSDYILGISDVRTISQSTIVEESFSSDEIELINLFRKLPVNMRAEIKGEIKGILRSTSQETTATLEKSSSNKRAI